MGNRHVSSPFSLLRFVCFCFFFAWGKYWFPGWPENFWVMLCFSAFWRRGNLLLRSENQTTFCCLAQDFAEHFQIINMHTYDRKTKPPFKSLVFFAFPAPPTLPLPPQKNREDAAEEQPTMWLFFFFLFFGGGREGETHGLGPFRMTQNDRLYFLVCLR